MKFLLILFSVFLNFAIVVKASSGLMHAADVSAAKSIYAKITGLKLAVQKYYSLQNGTYANASIKSVCNAINVSGVCGQNNDGIYQSVRYTVAPGSASDKISISLYGVKKSVAHIVMSLLVNKSSSASVAYQGGVITVIYTASDRFLRCNFLCADTSSDLSGTAFLSCLENTACTNAGIVKDNTTPSSNLEALITSLSRYSNLNAGDAILTHLAACRSNVLAAGTNYASCVSAVNSYCGYSGITMDNIDSQVITFKFLANCFVANQLNGNSIYMTPTIGGCTTAYNIVQTDNTNDGISVDFYSQVPGCDGFVATSAQCTAACNGVSGGSIDAHMLTNGGSSSSVTPTNYQMCNDSNCSTQKTSISTLMSCIGSLKAAITANYTYDSCNTASINCSDVSSSLSGSYVTAYANCGNYLASPCHTACLFNSAYGIATFPSNPVTSGDITTAIENLLADATLQEGASNFSAASADRDYAFQIEAVCRDCGTCYNTTVAGTNFLTSTQSSNYSACVTAGYS